MTSKEAICDLKKRNEALKKEGHFHIGTQVMSILDELVERDTQMKPLKVNNTKLIYWCSKCDCSSIQRYDKFCHECGQRLDW